MSASVTTHVLDTAQGRPARGIRIGLFSHRDGHREHVATAVTNDDGRTEAPLASNLAPGTYELLFDVAGYFAEHRTPSFFDAIPVRFVVDAEREHYHVPLLLSPWGYSTYRGS